jgi:hypothetical protein
MNSAKHPSFFALDQAVASGNISVTLQQHADACQQCRQHLARIQPAKGVEPAWVANLASQQARIVALVVPKRSLSTLVQWLVTFKYPLMLAVPAAAALLFLVRPSPRLGQGVDADPYVGVKSAGPMLWTYIRRSEKTFLWDGTAAVAPGDRIRLKVDPARLTFVSAFSRAEDGSWKLLWAGRSDGKNPLALPVAWEIDEQPGQERLLIVASRQELTAAERSDPGIVSNNQDRWSQALFLQKSGHASESSPANLDASGL